MLFIAIVAIVVLIVMTRKNATRIEQLEAKIEYLMARYVPEARPAEAVAPAPIVKEKQAPSAPVYHPAVGSIPRVDAVEEFVIEEEFDAPFSPQGPVTPKAAFNFEQQFGARLPVWIGGISLALAGFFMVKYSIENQLVSPTMRVIFALIMGLGLVGAGQWIFRRPAIANSARLCQSLTGAGIVCLYGAFFAASNLYDLIPSMVSFFGMLGVTALAVILSVFQGPAVAVFGLIGGFLTPILIGSDEPNTLILFIYLYGLTMSLLYLARRQGWLWLSLPVYGLALLWALGWVAGAWNAADSIWVALYLVLLMLAAPFVLFRSIETTDSKVPRISAVIGSVGSLLLLSEIVSRAEFTHLHWALFGVAGLGAIALAALKPRLYYFAPAVAAGITGFLLLSWTPPDAGQFFMVLGAFSVVYFGAGVALMFRAPYPAWWAVLALLTPPVAYSLGYHKFEDDLVDAWPWLAFAVALIEILLINQIQRNLPETFAHKAKLSAAGALLSVSMISWGLYLALDTDALMIALALQMTGIAWLVQKYGYAFLRAALKLASFVFALTLLPELKDMLTLVLLRDYQDQYSRLDWMPVLVSGVLVSATGFMNVGTVWRRVYTSLGAAMVVSALYALIQRQYGPVFDDYTLRLTTLTMLWAAVLAAIRFAPERYRMLVHILIAYAVGSTAIDFFTAFPATGKMLGYVPVFNALIPAFAIPAAGMALAGHFISAQGRRDFSTLLYIGALFYAFMFVTMEVSHFYQRPYVFKDTASLAEIYTYSAAWLVFGLALLVWGTLKTSKLLRVTSLIVMIGTVCKVFLYDASELDGIYRVLSFLGLGLSLMALGYFYPRFVFKQGEKGGV